MLNAEVVSHVVTNLRIWHYVWSDVIIGAERGTFVRPYDQGQAVIMKS
jgi:hypothetical protein